MEQFSGRVSLLPTGPPERQGLRRLYDVSPVVLEAPYDDYWYLVVDSNGLRARVQVTAVFY